MLRSIFFSLCLLGAMAPAAFAGQSAILGFEFARESWFWPLFYDIGGETLYCGYAFGIREQRTTVDGFRVVVEHAYPAAWIAEARGCRSEIRCSDEVFQYAVADLHNLWPVISSARSARGELVFGEGSGGGTGRLTGRCLRRHEDASGGGAFIEPRDAVKGDLARSILYMMETYDLPARGLENLLRRWHDEDPPDETERWRNFVIERLQGTRNPYIGPWVAPP
ncbi:MAG: hypothetical protein GWN84_02380 [Gammaproteobacteria bacterium]|nr:hypothetical protein [Gammaproteobacteria bacterium]NIR81993.1 hypothetical protein [Gammaproteobacteria bacterium]NIR89050.1 hypothetical protein [Gammaproteobacteria bacterium]NIU03100.1 hypothetical protein [Gammaproteobacteria bacterium]NIV50624.1 hypothetical protein [Gammaproteobacteria bacterium]